MQDAGGVRRCDGTRDALQDARDLHPIRIALAIARHAEFDERLAAGGRRPVDRIDERLRRRGVVARAQRSDHVRERAPVDVLHHE